MKALEKRMVFNGVNYNNDKNLQLHRDRMKNTKKSIDNGLPSTLSHRQDTNSPNKKVLAKRAAKEHIYRENFFLAKRIFDIMEGDSDLMEKINDNRHVDNHPGTMNFRQRLHEAQRIHHRNMILAERLHTIKPHYKVADLSITKTVKVKSPKSANTTGKKKSKFMKELEYTFAGGRSSNQSPSPRYDNTGELIDYGLEADGTPARGDQFKSSNRPRSILLEYTKVQDNRVLDIAVLKEPYRDSYVIFGKDIEDGQRYELRLSSEDVSNILDGDILVTSVDNVEVWMALLQKVKLQVVDYFTKLPFTRQEVDFVTRGYPGGSLDKPGDEGEAVQDIVTGEEMDFESQDISSPRVKQSNGEEDQDIEKLLDVDANERVFTPSAPSRPGRSSEGPRKQGSYRRIRANDETLGNEIVDPSNVETAVLVTAYDADDSITQSEPPIINDDQNQALDDAIVSISEVEQLRLRLILIEEEQKKEKEREERESALARRSTLVSPPNESNRLSLSRNAERPKTNPKSRESIVSRTEMVPPEVVQEEMKEKAKVEQKEAKKDEKKEEKKDEKKESKKEDAIPRKTVTGRASILNKQHVSPASQPAVASSSNPFASPTSNGTANATPKKPSAPQANNATTQIRRSTFKSPSSAPVSSEPIVSSGKPPLSKNPPNPIPAPVVASEEVVRDPRQLSTSVKLAISGIVNEDILKAERNVLSAQSSLLEPTVSTEFGNKGVEQTRVEILTATSMKELASLVVDQALKNALANLRVSMKELPSTELSVGNANADAPVNAVENQASSIVVASSIAYSEKFESEDGYGSGSFEDSHITT